MNEKHNFRYDPLYRVIDETEEMRIVEGNFKILFDRLKGINNLGIIPKVFGMAKYPKYEHELGTIHQINSLLEIADKNTIPDKYRKPLKLASLFLHIGHLPFTYSTERALLLASNLGDRSQDNKIKKYARERIKKVLDKGNFGEDKKQTIVSNIFSLRDYKLLYKYFSGDILVSRWGNLKDKFGGLNDEDLEILIRDLIDSENDGYTYLNLADQADFVQRDALYFGTVRIDISPKHLYSGISKYMPRFSVSEEKLIEANLSYLTERFYDNPEVVWFSRLYEKILASLIISKNFKTQWLENYDDEQFKRLICDNFDKDNNKTSLPLSWIKKAKELFDDSISFTDIFDLRGVSFQKEKDAVDIEYELIEKKESERGLLTYPFDKGILLSIDYYDKYEFPVYPNYEIFSIIVFQDDSKNIFIELLKVIKNLCHHLSINHVENIRKSLGRKLSWTNEIRLDNGTDAIVRTVAEVILSIENGGEYKKGDFIEKYLKSISNISSFRELWHNSENQFWISMIVHFLEEHREDLEKAEIYKDFTNGLLSLPVQLLQYNSTKRYIDEIYEKLIEKLNSTGADDKKGDLFEALWLINRIRTRRGKFQFFLYGMIVIDLKKSIGQQDENEFDVIELLINDAGKAECWIYACSIADDYESKNREQITKLAEHIHRVFSDLIIRTRYIIPTNKSAGEWSPKEEDAGRNYY